MNTPTPNNNEQAPAVVAEFIRLVAQACHESGTEPPTWVQNFRAGDTKLKTSDGPADRPRSGPNMRAKARYTYHITLDSIAVIQDANQGHMSVTNDIVAVLHDVALSENLPSLAGHLVIYKDTLGRWDEVQLGHNGSFYKFYPLGGKSASEALILLRTRYNYPQTPKPIQAR